MPRYYRNMFSSFFSPPRVKQEETKSFYAYINGQQAGPMSEKEMKQLIMQGLVKEDTMIWAQGLPQWTKAATIPQIYKLLLLSSKTSNPKPAEPSIDKAKKEDILSALVALGFKKQAFGPKVDELLIKQPNITVEDAIIMLIKNNKQ